MPARLIAEQTMSERATKRTPEVIERIIDGLSNGTPLRELCRQDGMPAWRTVYSWLKADEELAARFAHARELGFDAIAEEALEIADDGTNDWMKRRRQDGTEEEVVNSEHIQRSKLRIETRLKLLAKWSPKKYGEKLDLAHTGADGAPLQINAVSIAMDAVKELRAARFNKQSITDEPKQIESKGDDLL
jgi:hypothetical protein